MARSGGSHFAGHVVVGVSGIVQENGDRPDAANAFLGAAVHHLVDKREDRSAEFEKAGLDSTVRGSRPHGVEQPHELSSTLLVARAMTHEDNDLSLTRHSRA